MVPGDILILELAWVDNNDERWIVEHRYRVTYFPVELDNALAAAVGRHGDDCPGADDVDTAVKLLGRETIGDRHDSTARSDRSQIRDDTLGRHRHVESNAVAGSEAAGTETFCKAIDFPFELFVAETLE